MQNGAEGSLLVFKMSGQNGGGTNEELVVDTRGADDADTHLVCAQDLLWCWPEIFIAIVVVECGRNTDFMG